MTFLLENPQMIAIIGGLTLAIIAGGWFQTQKRELVIAFLAMLVVVAGLLVLERSVVTDREAVKATIHTIARQAEAEDVAALTEHFHSSAAHYRDVLRSEMQLYQIQTVSVKNNLKVQVDRQHQPPQAVATFNVVVVGGDRMGVIQERNVPLFVTATFWLENGAWRCVDYKYEDMLAGMQRRRDEP